MSWTSLGISISENMHNLPLLGVKEITPINPEITFTNSDSNSNNMQSMVVPIIDHFVEPSKPTGRPKSKKLSALAAKRNMNKKNLNNTTSDKISVGKESTDGGDVPNISSVNNSGLSVSQKLALRQNLRHMVYQVRPGMDSTFSADLIGLTNGMHIEDYETIDVMRLVLKEPSNGMAMLFTGRNKEDHEFNSVKSLIPPKSVTALRSDSYFLRSESLELTSFNFETCPENDVFLDWKKEQEQIQWRSRQKVKRLIKPSTPKVKAQKRKIENVDKATIRKLLSKRCHQEKLMYPRIIVVGPHASGKSSLIGKLSHLLTDEPNQKMMSKLSWEAQKIGRPHDSHAWILDFLDCERKFGRSRDVAETMIKYKSDKIFHIFDCPGDFDLMADNIDMICLADKLVLVVDVNTASEQDSKEWKRIEDLFRIMSDKLSVVSVELMVVLNKMDQSQWSKGLAMKAVKILTTMLENSGFSRRHKLLFIPVSTRSAEGLVERRMGNDFDSESLSGKTIAQCFDRLSDPSTIKSEPQEYDLHPLVAVVHDTYENMGAGFTAVLLIKEGVLNPGQHLVCFPFGVRVHVRNIQLSQGSKLVSVAAAVRGELVHAVLWHVDFKNVQRGFVVCDPGLSPKILDMSNNHVVETSQGWKAEIFVHNLNGRSIIPGRSIIFHCFSKSYHGYLRRLLWVSNNFDRNKRKSDIDRDEDRDLTLNPFVVSSENVTLGIELDLDEPHSCLLEKLVNTEFYLFDGSSLFASGSLIDSTPNFSSRTDFPLDLRDRNHLLFHREMGVEDMDIDISNS